MAMKPQQRYDLELLLRVHLESKLQSTAPQAAEPGVARCETECRDIYVWYAVDNRGPEVD